MAISEGVRRIKFTTIDGKKTSLADFGDQTLLVVNVASKCGLTPQYAKLEELQKRYADQGFTVVGFPCNQFLGQEPGSAEDIKEFCSTTYGVTFPLMEKTRVNGMRKHPLYAALTREPDDHGVAGKVKWNFEKFVISPSGEVSRFRPKVQPDAPEVVAAIERGLGQSTPVTGDAASAKK
ncbi:glutathione peroxidase [Pseudolysinimonas yzui]|uniref:Glutathione peroxidase n=1 Tax=Pseudolysinimonas yzui TaxID=2708254 RepID=A0A8J3GP74_9MICO|nr:glutathione peroxidase [Pseudolysinimonas yzui]GHF10347.1 glutathione peroxidase [Pseudolysinimonas yzui]